MPSKYTAIVKCVQLHTLKFLGVIEWNWMFSDRIEFGSALPLHYFLQRMWEREKKEIWISLHWYDKRTNNIVFGTYFTTQTYLSMATNRYRNSSSTSSSQLNGSATWITSLHSEWLTTIFYFRSSLNHSWSSLNKLFLFSSFLLVVVRRSPLLHTTAYSGFVYICETIFKLSSLNFPSIDATPRLSSVSSFLDLSFLILLVINTYLIAVLFFIANIQNREVDYSYICSIKLWTDMKTTRQNKSD